MEYYIPTVVGYIAIFLGCAISLIIATTALIGAVLMFGADQNHAILSTQSLVDEIKKEQ